MTNHSITFQHVAFHYSNPFSQVFTDLSFHLDTHWRTGLIGRNGRGKSTLLGLVSGELQPQQGEIHLPVSTVRLGDSAGTVSVDGAASTTVLTAARQQVGDFDHWSTQMTALLEKGDEASIAAWSELHEQFTRAGGYEVDNLLLKELDALGITDAGVRCVQNLSLGQQTRVDIACLFVRQHLTEGSYALIDEPTNHLDLAGRRQLATYLEAQSGFLLVSHDRALLDHCTTHTLAINRSDVTVTQGNWSTWKLQQSRTALHESRVRRNIEGEVRQLGQAAMQRRQHAGSKEREKYRTGVMDKGYIGHRAAKQMKRALQVERRIEKQLEEKQELLKNAEKERELAITTELGRGRQALAMHNVDVSINEQPVVTNFSLTVDAGERIALTGPNGCGKTTLLRAITGQLPFSGTIRTGTSVSSVSQVLAWRRGNLRDQLIRHGFDETQFRQFLGAMDVRGDVFEQPLETLSQGQLKKVALCRSLLTPAGLLIWDEPMNYLDVDTREMIEGAILEGEPTLLFVDHDQRFIDTVATQVVTL